MNDEDDDDVDELDYLNAVLTEHRQAEAQARANLHRMNELLAEGERDFESAQAAYGAVIERRQQFWNSLADRID